MDGNKRIGWVAARIFFADNARILRFDPSEAIETMGAVAGGSNSEESLAMWFRERIENDSR